MHVTLNAQATSGPIAPVTLLGQNLEIAGETSLGLLSERLDNPKFVGPANPLTGLAPGWQPTPGNNFFGVRYELTPGLGLMGHDAQLIHNYSGRPGLGIVQTKRWTRAGEQVEVSLWARAQHHPVALRIGLRPWHARLPDYDAATLSITATYWKPYTLTLTTPCDDREAEFFCCLEGEGMVWLDQIHLRPAGTGPLRRELFERIRTLGIPVLRFPGGCISTNYHWRYGTGPDYLRPVLPDPVFKWETNYEFGTDEYLNLCQEMGIRPQITINIGTGTPAEAGEWAAYCAAWYRMRGIEPPVMYWQMGNEHYGGWEVGNLSGELYAEALHEFVPAVRAAYPKARIIALGVETGAVGPGGEQQPWRQPVLERAADLVDLLAIQYYVSGWDADPQVQQANVFRGVRHAIQTLERAIRDVQQRGLDIRVALTEWNLWFHATHHDEKGFLEPYDVQHALFVSAMLHQFVRLSPAMELANFYHLVNPMGIYRSRGPEFEETLLADVFRLYRPAFPGEVLSLAVASPSLADDLPAVDAACLRTSEATWLFLANRSLSETAQVVLNGLPALQESVLLVGDGPQGQFTSATVQAHAGQVELPPLSLARLRLGA